MVSGIYSNAEPEKFSKPFELQSSLLVGSAVEITVSDSKQPMDVSNFSPIFNLGIPQTEDTELYTRLALIPKGKKAGILRRG